MIAYHLTLTAHLESIKVKGLIPSLDELFIEDGDFREAVNLAVDTSPGYREPKHDDVFIVIDTTRLDQSLLEPVNDWWIRYYGTIPPSAIIEYRVIGE